MALALVRMLNEEFEAEVISADILSSKQVDIRVRLRPRMASRIG